MGWTHQRHRIIRLTLHERLVEHAPHVRLVPRRDLVEVSHERRVEETEFMLHLLEVLCQAIDAKVPKFTNHEPTLADVLIEVVDEVQQERLAVVLDRIEAEALQPELLPDPWSPRFHIILNLFVGVVEISEHQVICP